MESSEERRCGGGRGRGQSGEEGDKVGLGLGGECVEPSLPASGFVGRHGGWLGCQNKECVFLRKVESRQNRLDKQKTEVGHLTRISD